MSALSLTRIIFVVLFFLLILIVSNRARASSSSVVMQPHIEVSLISELAQVEKGKDFYLGFKLAPEDHWHVYWQNPGDSGMAPKITWELPKGVSVGELTWPYPEKIPVPPLVNYGYGSDIVLPVKFRVSEAFSGKEVAVKAKSSWLVCKQTCIPGKADLSIALPLGERKASTFQSETETAVSLVPKALPLISGTYKESGDFIEIELYAKKKWFADAEKIDYFSINENLIDYASSSEVFWKNNYLRLKHPKSDTFMTLPETLRGVLVLDKSQAWEFAVSQ